MNGIVNMDTFDTFDVYPIDGKGLWGIAIHSGRHVDVNDGHTHIVGRFLNIFNSHSEALNLKMNVVKYGGYSYKGILYTNEEAKALNISEERKLILK